MSKALAGLSDSVAKKGSGKESSKGSKNKKAASKGRKNVEAASEEGGVNVEGKKGTRARAIIRTPARYASPEPDEEVDDVSDNNPTTSSAIPKSPDGSLLFTEHFQEISVMSPKPPSSQQRSLNQSGHSLSSSQSLLRASVHNAAIEKAKAKLKSLHHQQQKPSIKSSTPISPSKSTSSAVHFGEISAVIQVSEEDDELQGSRKRKRSPTVIQESEEDDGLQGSRKRKRSLSTAVSDETPPSKRQTTNKREPWLDVTPLDAQTQSWMLITLLNKVKSVQKALSSRVSAAAAEAIMAPQIFPLTTSNQLTNVETRLTQEPNFVAKLHSELLCHGAATVAVTIRDMMDYLISRELAKLYTLDGRGRKDKKAFDLKKIVNVVKDAVRTHHQRVGQEVLESEFLKCLRRWFTLRGDKTLKDSSVVSVLATHSIAPTDSGNETSPIPFTQHDESSSGDESSSSNESSSSDESSSGDKSSSDKE